MNRFIEEAEDDDNEDQDDDYKGDGAAATVDKIPFKGSINRRKSILLRHRKSSRGIKTRGIVHPIYGIGVVFYLDNYGRILGIMTWGLPFADKVGGCINPELLKYIKYLITTNAGLVIRS